MLTLGVGETRARSSGLRRCYRLCSRQRSAAHRPAAAARHSLWKGIRVGIACLFEEPVSGAQHHVRRRFDKWTDIECAKSKPLGRVGTLPRSPPLQQVSVAHVRIRKRMAPQHACVLSTACTCDAHTMHAAHESRVSLSPGRTLLHVHMTPTPRLDRQHHVVATGASVGARRPRAVPARRIYAMAYLFVMPPVGVSIGACCSTGTSAQVRAQVGASRRVVSIGAWSITSGKLRVTTCLSRHGN